MVVDTSSWISYFRGEEIPAIDEALQQGRLYLPPLVAAELTSATLSPAKRRELIDFLRELPLVGSELDHWFRVGELRHKASVNGVTVSTPDAHVAQCCLDLEGTLVTEDKIFKKLRRVCPHLKLG